MRIESSVTSISWIPSEAIEGMGKLAMDTGVSHYDAPLPDRLENLEQLRADDRFRFANELGAWIEVEDGRIVRHGQAGKGHIGVTKMKVGPAHLVFQAVALPDLHPEPVAAKDSVKFVQTAGGRTGAPMPRRVRHKPFVQIVAPLAWTTLALTIHADGSSKHELLGASSFPRHWVYDHDGRLVQKSGIIDFQTWYREAFGRHTPWGEEDSPALVTEVETALERELSRSIMRGKPRIRQLKANEMLVQEGDAGSELFLLLDGVLAVWRDGRLLTEIGPGAILGERAVLEGGTRTSSLRAVTPCKVAAVSGDQVAPDALAEVARGHRREER
jgi:hypothetical protein